MFRTLLVTLALVAVATAIKCYSCDTTGDVIFGCKTTICNGELAKCYKREYTFKNDADKQYEERGCITSEDELSNTCQIRTIQEDVDDCEIYTCVGDRCNGGVASTLSAALALALLAFYLY